MNTLISFLTPDPATAGEIILNIIALSPLLIAALAAQVVKHKEDILAAWHDLRQAIRNRVRKTAQPRNTQHR